MNAIDCAGRVAVVTGGASGIGRAVSERLLASGASVAIWDKDEALARETTAALQARGRILAMACDVSEEASVASALGATRDALGPVDILVANAGITGPNAPVADYALADWERVFAVNTRGVFLCNRAVIPSMVAHNYGRIVNVASIAGKEGNPNAAAYSASKAAVIALTKSLGKELAAYDIAVNCITPAAAKTAIFAQMTEQHVAFMLSKIPRGRFVNVEEIAATIAFMCSAECSFTTGGVFDISGGRATY